MRKSLRALNAANFFMADVQAGLGRSLVYFWSNGTGRRRKSASS
jgi:hypothetical protein